MLNFGSIMAAALLLTTATAATPKRGLAANDNIPISKFGGSYKGHKSQINWHYNWDSTTTSKQPFAEFVPMLWGTNPMHTNRWHGNAVTWIKKGSKHLLGFNEPDHGEQARLTPAEAVAGWRKYMEPFAGQVKLGAPAVTNGGYDWLSQFLNQCKGCHIDFVPVHWYNDHTLEKDLENWVNKVCKLVKGRKVWITEVCLTALYLYGNCTSCTNARAVPRFRVSCPAERIP